MPVFTTKPIPAIAFCYQCYYYMKTLMQCMHKPKNLDHSSWCLSANTKRQHPYLKLQPTKHKSISWQNTHSYNRTNALALDQTLNLKHLRWPHAGRKVPGTVPSTFVAFRKRAIQLWGFLAAALHTGRCPVTHSSPNNGSDLNDS